MNVFEKIAAVERVRYLVLGSPLYDLSHMRLTSWSFVRGGKGFRQEPKEPKRRAADNTTRGMRKRSVYKRLFLS